MDKQSIFGPEKDANGQIILNNIQKRATNDIYLSSAYNDPYDMKYLEGNDVDKEAKKRAARYAIEQMESGEGTIAPTDLAKVREVAIDDSYYFGKEPQIVLPENMKIHAIKDIQRQEYLWGEQGVNHDSSKVASIFGLVVAGVGLIAAINAVYQGNILGGLQVAGFMGGLGGLMIFLERLTEKSVRKGELENLERIRFFYNITVEEELDLLHKLVATGNEEVREMIMIHEFIRGVSNGTYEVKLSETTGQLEVIEKDEQKKGMGISI